MILTQKSNPYRTERTGFHETSLIEALPQYGDSAEARGRGARGELCVVRETAGVQLNTVSGNNYVFNSDPALFDALRRQQELNAKLLDFIERHILSALEFRTDTKQKRQVL